MFSVQGSVDRAKVSTYTPVTEGVLTPPPPLLLVDPRDGERSVFMDFDPDPVRVTSRNSRFHPSVPDTVEYRFPSGVRVLRCPKENKGGD